jgi:DNA-binding NarL/FixJ family response regulator
VVVPGILIVDDNPSIRYLLRVCVESKTGFPVCGEAGHGVEAIEKARALHPDLIILDLSMPVMNGAEAAVVLKRSMPQVKIILFTMHADNVGKALSAAVGIDLTLSKSDGLMNLHEHVKALLAQTPLPAHTPVAVQSEDLTKTGSASATQSKPSAQSQI